MGRSFFFNEALNARITQKFAANFTGRLNPVTCTQGGLAPVAILRVLAGKIPLFRCKCTHTGDMAAGVFGGKGEGKMRGGAARELSKHQLNTRITYF